jgi:hypothetical protein
MKKLILILAIVSTALTQNVYAQHDHAAHQQQATTLLPLYYSIKDALVIGDAALAASKTAYLVKAIKDADSKAIANKDALLNHAGKIAKASKLATEPIYQQYCPMKKSNWLSSEKPIKNPYYGSSMLTCGQVVATIK